MTTSEIVKRISQASNRYGDRLIEMLEFYSARGLIDLTDDQIHDYWQSHAKEIERSRNNEQ